MNFSLSFRSRLRPGPSVCALLFAVTLAAQSTLPVEPPHPILPVTGEGRSADRILRDYTEEQFLAFVPQGPPRQARPFAPAVIVGDTGWSWSVERPDQLTSTPSGTVFPREGERFESVEVLSGKTVRVPWYPSAARPDRKSLVQGEIDNQKRKQLRRFLNTLTPAYLRSGDTHATRNQAYARRIAVALDHWAKFVPDYYLTEKGGATFISARGFTRLTKDIQRASDHNGLAHEWQADELRAFDAIYDSPALAQLSQERGYDVRRHIATGIFFNIGDYFLHRVPVEVAIATNLSGSFTVFAQVATVLHRPDYIGWLGAYLDATVRRKVMRDGVLGEGIGYSYRYLEENRRAAEATAAYFDLRPAATPELAAIRAHTRQYRDLITRGLATWDTIRLPNGQQPSFGDTIFDQFPRRDTGRSALLPAYGHLALGAGDTADTAVQLNQSFADNANHMRSDVTALGLWALGDELLGNIRYVNALPGRQFTEEILAHNAVTVDRRNMERTSWDVGGRGHTFAPGTLTLFEPGHGGLALSEIDGQRAYGHVTSRYQRLVLLNTVDVAHPYVVDLFRVSGGTVHDYTLHGSIRFDQTSESSVALTPMPGTHPLLESQEKWTDPKTAGDRPPFYGVFRDVLAGQPAGDFHLTFRDAGDAHRDLRLWMTGDGSAAVFLARSPNPGRANNSMNFYQFWRPSVLVRHRAQSPGLETLYAGVIEPLRRGVSQIRSVTRLPLATPTRDAVALQVTLTDGRVDTYVISLPDPRLAATNPEGAASVATADGRFALTGRVGVALRAADGTTRAWTMAASSFQHEHGRFTPGPSLHTGEITAVLRRADGAAHDAFVVDGSLPTGTALRGRYASVSFGDYRVVGERTVQKGLSEFFAIDRVEVVDGRTRLILQDDPQLALTGTTLRELVAPERTFTGRVGYAIAVSAASF